jgi:hypothetical protein
MRGAGAGRAGETAVLRQFQHPLEARAGRAQSQDRREAPITPRRVVTFKPSPVLVARVNGETIAEEEE